MTEFKKILVLCQRKFSKTNSENLIVQNYVKSIENYTNNLYPNALKTYTYLTDCVDIERDGSNCADFIFQFNPENKQTIEFIHEYKKTFDIIILQQCPIPFFNPFIIYGISRLLKTNGELHIVSLWLDKISDTLYIYQAQNKSDQDSEFYKGPNTIEQRAKITDYYIQWPENVRNIIKSLFIWSSVGNIPVLVLKRIPDSDYILYLIEYFCLQLKNKKNYVQNLFILLPYPVQMYFKKAAKYCLIKNEGDLEVAKNILRLPIII